MENEVKYERIAKEIDIKQNIKNNDFDLESIQTEIIKLQAKRIETQLQIVLVEALFRIGICFMDEKSYLEFLKTQVIKSEKDNYLTFYYENNPFLRIWFDIELNNEEGGNHIITNVFNYKYL